MMARNLLPHHGLPLAGLTPALPYPGLASLRYPLFSSLPPPPMLHPSAGVPSGADHLSGGMSAYDQHTISSDNLSQHIQGENLESHLHILLLFD